ncbi:MAG: peptide-methionine (R)-S-oxide reductase MsrB [Saprospiraceae bacterium]|nr:peptide-methionine (R)-S-oxide reductase MsrB [Saprospiraceae bacterium]
MYKLFLGCLSVLLFFVSSCQTPKGSNQVSKSSIINDTKTYFLNMRGDTIRKLALSDETWKSKLSEMEYKVLRQKGTERAFTGDLLDNKVEGLYTCRGCGMPLFASKHKFESGTGWPSFFDVPDKVSIDISTDYDLGYARSELTCAKCGGHLGHVFDDGPKPTGKRYCINSVSLDFVKAEN